MTSPYHKKIIGSGGGGGKDGGGGSRSPVEANDTLRSLSKVKIVDVLCEGEIVGLVNGVKSIFLDETPIQNTDGSNNFVNIGIDTRTGTQSQSYMSGFSQASNEVSVDAEMRYGDGTGGAVIRQITNPDIDRIRVTILIPSLMQTDISNGDTGGNSVDVSVWIKPNGGSYSQVASRHVAGKSSGRYEFSIDFPLSGSGPWTLKVQRDTPDSTSQYSQNKTFLSSYTEITDAKLRYPNTALVGIIVDAQQFSSIPSRYYEVDLLKIHIPTNYNDVTRVYTGTWDGTFKLSTGACNNPAWVFYDILSSTRYGLGKFISVDQIDKWALYEIGKYCDELVSDGKGGLEPRFTCNILIQDRSEAYSVLQGLASIFRSMIYWGLGTVTAVQDSPKDAVYLFTNANVVDGVFSYQGASSKSRHSVALVQWNDPNNFYKPAVEYVEDQDAIAQFGVIETQVIALGCTSQGQAHRFGKWILFTEQAESETVTFKTGLDGLVARPGQIIKVADDAKAGVRLGGRISNATTTAVTVDQDVTVSLAGASLSVLLPDGTVEERQAIGLVGRAIQVQPAFSQAPNNQGIWVLKIADVDPQSFRVISVSEDESGTFIINALRYDGDKFDAIENGISLETKSYSILSAIPESPKNVKVTETLYLAGSEVKSKFTISCDRVPGANSYVFRYRYDTENFVELPATSFNDIDVLDSKVTGVTVEVYALSALGVKSAVSTASAQLYGKTSLPSDVTGFSMIPNQGLASLTWDRAIDLDVLIGGFVRIRHTPRITGQAWKDGVDIVPALAGSSNSATVPLITGTYMIKFVDSSGNFSPDEAIVVTTIPDAVALNVVQTITESPTFPGTLTDMLHDTAENAIVLASGTLIDDVPSIDGLGNIDYPGDIVSSGTYDFQNTVDLGGVWPTNIRRVIDLEAFDIGNLIDQRVDNIDDWTDIDGDIVNDVNAELFVRTTTDNPSASPTWTDWKSIPQGSYSARGFQFRLICSSGYETHNLWIKTLSVTLDVDDRVENLGPITSGAGTYNVTYNYPFYANPSIGITATNMQTGDIFTISSESTSGFSIIFKNSAGTTVSRNFYVMAKGYGRKIA